MKKSLLQKSGLSGVVSFLSYTAAVVFSPLALTMMLAGALGMKIVPAEYFGVVERFSVFAATGFNAALGIHMFFGEAEISDSGNNAAGTTAADSVKNG